MAVTMSNVKNVGEELYIGPRIPQGLTAAIEGLTKEIIRHRPEDIYIFAANHFEKLLEIRKQYDSPDQINSKATHEKLIISKELDKQSKKKFCECKKKSRSQDVTTLRASGWSLNETAKVLKRHRSIFGDVGKKISLDEIYALANVKSPGTLHSKYKDSKDHAQKSKSHKKHQKVVEHESLQRQSSENNREKRGKGDRSSRDKMRKTNSQHTTSSSRETKKIKNDKVESFESSTKISSNVQETNYSSQTSKLSIEELQSSSYVQKIYKTIHETTSVMEEKVQELKQFSGRMSKSEINNYPESGDDNIGQNLSNKLSKSATCLNGSDKTKTDIFETKLKETQHLLEKISTNFNQTMKRSMSAKDLRRASHSGEFPETKITDPSGSSSSKLRQIFLPTVRPVSASKNELLRKYSLNGTDNCLTLPLILQKPSRSTKQSDSDLTLPILSPPSNGSLVASKSTSEEANQHMRSETYDQSVIKDTDKLAMNISEKETETLKSDESKQLVKPSEKKSEDLKSTSVVTPEKKTEDTKSSPGAESKTKEIKSTSPIENKEVITSVSEVEDTKCVESNSKEIKSASSTEREIEDTKDISEATSTSEIERVKHDEKNEKDNVKVSSEETDKRAKFRNYRCPSYENYDCNKGINNELLRSKLEELVKAEESILQESTSDLDSNSKEEEEFKETDQLKTKDIENLPKPKEINPTDQKETTPSRYSEKSSSSRDFLSAGNQNLSASEERGQSSDKELMKSPISDDNVYSYILTEGSPCEIPDTVTTVIIPDKYPSNMSDDIDIKVDEINNEILSNVFGEPIQYYEMDYNSMMNVDLMRGMKGTHDISIARQDLHRIKEEEEEEEENEDISVNEDSTIVLEKILENEEVEGSQEGKDEKESDLSLQEFLLHCTLNEESTEDTSINDMAEDAVIPIVPELDLKVIEDATESTSKTSRQKSDEERSIDEIENSFLPTERTSTSIRELEGLSHESLSGDQQPTARDESSLLLDTNLMDSSKSTTSPLFSNAKLIRAVVTIQKYYRQYKSKKHQEASVLQKDEVCSKKTAYLTEQTVKEKEESKIEENKTSSEKYTEQKEELGEEGTKTSSEKCTEKEEESKVEETETSNEKRTKQEESKVEAESSTEKDHKQKDESIRKQSISSLNNMIYAALTIQKYYRKYKSRKLREISIAQKQVVSSTTSEKHLEQKEENVNKKSTSTIPSLNEMVCAALIIQKYYRKYKFKTHKSETSLTLKKADLQIEKESASSVSKETDFQLQKESTSSTSKEMDVQPQKESTSSTSKETDVQFQKDSTTSTSKETDVQLQKDSTSSTSKETDVQLQKESTSSTPKETDVQLQKDSTSSTPKETDVQLQKDSTSSTSKETDVQLQKDSTSSTPKETDFQLQKDSTSSTSKEMDVQLQKDSTSSTPKETDVQLQKESTSSTSKETDHQLETKSSLTSQEKHDLQNESTSCISKVTDVPLQKESIPSTINEQNLQQIEKTKISTEHQQKESIKKESKTLSFDKMARAVVQIQKYYRKYKTKKLEEADNAKKIDVPSTSVTPMAESYLQHTGEFHDCIPLSVLDVVPRPATTEKKTKKSSKSADTGDFKRTRREWNRNPPLSPSVLCSAAFSDDLNAKDDNVEETEDSRETPCNDRFPGVMIYADTLKNSFKQSAPQHHLDKEAQKFMNFVLLSGEEPMLQNPYVNPRQSGVIIEEISNDEDQS